MWPKATFGICKKKRKKKKNSFSELTVCMCMYVKGKHLMGVSYTLGSNEGAGSLCVCAGVCVMSGGVTL